LAYVVMVRPYEDGLVMHQLRYRDEIKPWSEVPLTKMPKPAPSELALASQVIESLRHSEFDPTQYTDEVKSRVRALIAKKAKGGEIVVPEHEAKPAIVDLMAALKASLEGEAPPKPKRANQPRKRAPRARPHARARSTRRPRTHV
jgi:DNA end-binding protein Ku